MESNQLRRTYVFHTKTNEYNFCLIFRGEHVTRYSEKVKSGEIAPYVPEWQRLIEEKKKEAEKRLLEKERRKFENEQKKIENEKLKQEKCLMIEQEKRLIYEQKQRDRELKQQEILLERELRKMEPKLLKEEMIKMMIAKRPLRLPSRWILFYKNSVNGNPYQQTFKPRHSKVDQRIQ